MAENGAAPTISVPMFTRDPRFRAGQTSRGLDPSSEIGTTGLKQFGGFVLEEWLSQLSGKRGAWAYRELMDNSPVLGGIMFAIRMLARQVDWRVEQEKAQRMPNGMSTVEFGESCMHDMSHSWGDFVSEALSMIGYGWSAHEEVFKRREGPKTEGDIETPETEEDTSPASSQFTDGLLGWRKLPVRAQETLLRWEFSGYSTPRAMEQVDWHGGTHLIPIEKLLLFRTEAVRDNPEGRSFFRPAWTSYYAIKNIQQIESIGIERDLAGLPMLTPPEGVDLYANTTDAKNKLARAEELVQSVRKDEAMGIVLPSAGWKFELVRAPGSRQIDTNEVIKRHRQEMAAAVLADFLLVGLDGLGSYAMVDVKSDLFGLAVDAVLDIICEVFNRFGFPRLFRLNGVTLQTPLKLNHSSAGRLDLERVGEFLYKLSAAGAPIPWSNEMIEQLFNEAGLPANFDGETTVNVHKADDEIDVTLPLADRARVLSLQLESEVTQALKDLGEQAASAYLHHAPRVEKDARALAQRVLRTLNVKAWVQRRLMPIMRNAGARTAADTQRVLRDLIDREVQVDAAAVEKAAGVDLKASDIEPQVREAIMAAISEGTVRGEHPARTAQRIREMVPPGRFTKAGGIYRANLIARDQTLRAQRAATLSAYESMPNVTAVRLHDGVYGPPRSDAQCMDRDGEIVPIEEAAEAVPYHPQCTLSLSPVVGVTAERTAVPI